jgi:hypothetical protein
MKGTFRAAAAALAAGALSAAPCTGQRWQIDAGGSIVRVDTLSELASFSLTPLVELSRGRLYGAVGGSYTSFEQSHWAFQGQANLSLLLAPAGPAGPLRIELAGAAGGSDHSSGYRTGVTRGETRLYLMAANTGAWLGGTVRTGWTSSTQAIALAAGPSAGAWVRGHAWHVTAFATPFRLEGFWFPEAQAHGLTWIGPADVAAYGGWRGAPRGSGTSAAAWGGANVALWLGRNVALVIGAGTYPRELIQALPGGRYVSGALRLANRRPQVPAPSDVGRAVYAPAPGDTELRFRATGATRVELVGDWTTWQPVPLRRAPDGGWVMRVTLARGVYRFNLVVDGNRWIVPDGVAAVDDGFGGRMALLVVP